MPDTCAANRPRRRTRSPWRPAALAFLCALLVWPGDAAAQLGPGDLQRAHALTANSAGWVALREAVGKVIENAGIDIGEASDEAADTLAVLLALEDGGGRLDAIVIGAARGAMTAQLARDPEVNRVFADHGLTLARAKAISCLVFGHDPERRASIAPALGLTEAEMEYCPTAYGEFRDYWLEVAAPIRAANGGAGEPATIELTAAGGTMASARAVLMAGQTLHEVAHFLSNAIATPQPLRVHAADCERADTPAIEEDEVRVCYDLVRELATGIERGIVAAR